MAFACILLVEELRFDLLKLCLDIGMVRRKFPEKCKVPEPFIGLAMIDEVAWCLRDKRYHETHKSTRDDLDTSDKVSQCTNAASAHTYS